MATPAPSTSDTSPPPIAAEYPPPTSSSQTPPPIAVEPPPAAPPPIAAEPPPAAPPPIAVDPPPSAPPPIATESPPIIAPPPLSVEPPPMAPPPLAVEPPPFAPSPLPVEPPPAITPPPLPVDQPPPNIAAPPSPVEPPPAAPPPLPVDQPPSPPTLSSPPSLPPSYPPPPLPYDSPPAPPPAPGLPPETSYTPPSPINFAPPPPPPPPPYVPPPPNSTHNPPPPPSPLQSPPPPLPPQTNTTSNSTSNTTTSAFPSPPARLGPPTPSTSESTTSTAIGVSIAAAVAVSLILLLAGCIAKNRNKKKRKDYYNNQYYCPPGAQNVQHYQDGYNREGQWNRPYPPSESGIKLGAPSLSPYSPNPSGAMGGGSSYQYSGSTGYPSGGFGSIGPPSTSGGGPPGSSVSSLHQFAGASKSCFTYEELMAATEGFSTANVLGEGGFGKVYKGMLPEGKVVAVKQLKAGGGQGEREFQAEVEIISRVHHRHLVSLVGFCIADSHRLLVYEFVPNGTLEHHLHGRGVATMDWPTRMKIAIGAARGLAYLHEDCHPRIIHRDIKSANILIDNNFEAQVADFGLAKLTEDTSTHVTTRVMGTFGYLAPEYAASGKLTDRSDVFSFGVVLLELLTGRKPVDGSQPMGSESLVEWSRPLLAQVLEEGNLELMADPKLNGAYDSTEMMRMVEAASASVRYSAQKRPRMSHVVRALEDDIALSELNKAGGRPGQSSIFSGTQSSEYSVGQYSADMKKFREIALNEQDSDSDSSAATTEYGLNPSDSSGEYPLSKDFHGKHSSTSHQPHKKNESSGSGYSLR